MTARLYCSFMNCCVEAVCFIYFLFPDSTGEFETIQLFHVMGPLVTVCLKSRYEVNYKAARSTLCILNDNVSA